jgi:Primase C terminal 2 (PriCT-2)/AAA domain
MDLPTALDPVTSRVRTDRTAKFTKSSGMVWTHDSLTEERLKDHVNGGVARGVCPIKENESVTRLAVLDLDSHKGEVTWSEIATIAQKVIEELRAHGLHSIPWRSRGGNGIHLYILWDEPQDAASVRKFLQDRLESIGYKDGAGGVKEKRIEIFPKQNFVAPKKVGNQFILPLAGQSVPLEELLGLEPQDKDYALTLEWKISTPVPIYEPPVKLPKPKPEITPERSDLEKMLHYVDPDLDYPEWIKVGMAIHHTMNGAEEGLEVWDEHSSYGGKYKDSEEVRYHYEKFDANKENSVTIGTLLHLARRGGYTGSLPVSIKVMENNGRFEVIPAHEFAGGEPPVWLIEDIFPQTGLGMIYGESGVGKTFFVLDIVGSVARGASWCGHQVKKGKVVYIVAEGVSGFRKRLTAYSTHYGIPLEELPIGIIADEPNLYPYR